GFPRAARPAAFGRGRCRLALRRRACRWLAALGLAGLRVAGGLAGGRRRVRLALGLLALLVAGVRGMLRAHLTLAEPACPRKMRVGANSPSLCPTIDSLMNTGRCLRPSCTAIVCPTISGKIVDARDHVRSIFLLFSALRASIRAIKRASTQGPFLLERLIAACPSRGDGRARSARRRACSACACGSRAGAPHT